MKVRFIGLILFSVLLTTTTAFAGKVGDDCTFKGKKLYGKVQYVDSFPDLKIKFVDSFPDLEVEKVTSSPSKCGQWQIVNSFADLKVKVETGMKGVKIIDEGLVCANATGKEKLFEAEQIESALRNLAKKNLLPVLRTDQPSLQSRKK